MAVIHVEDFAGTCSLQREVNFAEKYRITTASGRIRREVAGVYVNYRLELGNVDAQQYDVLWELLTSPDEYHTVVMPDGVRGEIEFDAIFDGVSDELLTEDSSGNRYWDHLTVQFTMAKPLQEVKQ